MTFKPSNLKIALQKSGRLADKSLELLTQIGLDFDRSKDCLFAQCRNFPLDILFLRDDDIPEYVQDGVCDLGIVGKNMIMERKAAIKPLLPLGFGVCRLAIAVPEKSEINAINDLEGKKIASSFPVCTQEYLRQKNIGAEMIQIRGSVEVAPSLGLSDAIADLVSTGNTLKQSGLRELTTILESEAMLIQSQGMLPQEKQSVIDRLLLRIQSTLDARNSKYILMNAPTSALQAIKSIIPSLSSPTVMPLATDGMIAVHSVIQEEIFFDVIERLKALGASGILVLNIEKMIR